MLVELDKKGLMTLIKGCDVPYELMGHAIANTHGSFNGSHGVFNWHYDCVNSVKFTETELYNFYLELAK